MYLHKLNENNRIYIAYELYLTYDYSNLTELSAKYSEYKEETVLPFNKNVKPPAQILFLLANKANL